MAATRKFYVRRNNSFKKANTPPEESNATPVGGGAPPVGEDTNSFVYDKDKVQQAAQRVLDTPVGGQPKKVEEPKVEEPKVEEPKVEEPKVEEPKVEDEPKTSPKAKSSEISDDELREYARQRGYNFAAVVAPDVIRNKLKADGMFSDEEDTTTVEDEHSGEENNNNGDTDTVPTTDEKPDESFVEWTVDDNTLDKWKKYRNRDIAAAGLGLATNFLDRAVGAFGSLIKLGDAFLQNPLSAPTGTLKRMLATTVVDSGVMMQNVIDDIGAVWGIKDGVQQKDIAGTYKGAQYYNQKRDAEAIEKAFGGDMDRLTKEIFGENANPEQLADLLANAVNNNDVVSVKKLLEGLQERHNSEQVKGYVRELKKEIDDAKNPNIPKDKRYHASPAARAYNAYYTRYVKGLVQMAGEMGGLSSREIAEYMNAHVGLDEDKDLKSLYNRVLKKEIKDTERKLSEEERKQWFDKFNDDQKKFIETIESTTRWDFPQTDGAIDADGLPAIINPYNARNILRIFENKSNTQGGLTPDEQIVYDALKKRLSDTGGRRSETPQEKSVRKVKEIYNSQYSDGFGGSYDNNDNKRLQNIALSNMSRLRRRYEGTETRVEDDPEYIRWYNAYQAATLSELNNSTLRLIDKYALVLNRYLAAHPESWGRNTDDLRGYVNGFRVAAGNIWGGYDENSTPVYRVPDEQTDFDAYEAYDNVRIMNAYVKNLINNARRGYNP